MIAITPQIIFSKEVAQKQATPFPRQDLLTARNRFRLNFRGWRLDESSIFARPPPRWPSCRRLVPHLPPGRRHLTSRSRCTSYTQLGTMRVLPKSHVSRHAKPSLVIFGFAPTVQESVSAKQPVSRR